MEILVSFLLTLLVWVLLLVFTSLVWWAALLIAIVVAVVGVYLGPELFN